MKEFIIGVNYWASHAGTNMWRDWNEEIVRNDLRFLSKNNIKTLRVFPIWPDFQPIKPYYTSCKLYEYRMEDDSLPKNPYYLDETMLSRFDKFLDICGEFEVEVIVGLITGWMSGRLFVPTPLLDKNVYTDATSLMFQEKFVRGFVSRFKHRNEIKSWDLGNECNCMMWAQSRAAAYNWTALISNTIKSVDNTREVVSGMDGLTLDGTWNIADQAELLDVFTTHPYPYWVANGSIDSVTSMRTLLLPTALNKLCIDIGGKPSLVEEIGTMGPQVCSEEIAGDVAKVNLFSTWANGAEGMMWWCAFDQTHLKFPPYSWKKCEVELGIAENNVTPKPALLRFKEFADFLNETKLDLPKAREDATVILTIGQDQRAIGWMSYVLAKMAGANLKFGFAENEIPESDIYLLPSICGSDIMPQERLDDLIERVYNGATLYISCDDGMLPDFSKFTGVKNVNFNLGKQVGSFELCGKRIEFSRNCKHYLELCGAKEISENSSEIVFTKYSFGKGMVYYLNYPLEKNFIGKTNAFEGNDYLIYKQIFAEKECVVTVDNKYLGVTEHLTENGAFAIVINYSPEQQATNIMLNENYVVDEVVCGNINSIKPFESTVIKLKKKI
ncbi:MAG: cellulase family glycosylhydrolase [Clostridia bacterium]|nr:cellulase family glycosylhydrolase [Clostridia bacterium]